MIWCQSGWCTERVGVAGFSARSPLCFAPALLDVQHLKNSVDLLCSCGVVTAPSSTFRKYRVSPEIPTLNSFDPQTRPVPTSTPVFSHLGVLSTVSGGYVQYYVITSNICRTAPCAVVRQYDITIATSPCFPRCYSRP